MAKSFSDERGTIEDILDGPLDSVTKIFTKAGAVRGNHLHAHTTQWVYVVSGRLRTATPGQQVVWYPGALIEEPPGVPHAWRAEEDTVVLVLTRGPRSGENYESDTIRLAPEDHLL
jgi:quercetin dioxygenase-like cupin family protein